MIRVGLILSASGSSWTGGSNYYANLLGALRDLPDRRTEVVALVPPGRAADFDVRFPADRIVETRAFTRGAAVRSAGKVAERLIGRNLVAEATLRASRIDILSHADPLGARSSFPTIGWIPDFQEIHLPGFFSPDEIARRGQGHKAYAASSRRIVLSSEDAQRDLARLHPEALPRARVLHFVSGIGDEPVADPATLAARYGLPPRWFHVPNQLWVHKNHLLVVRALAILKDRSVDATVIATGPTEDFRRPGFAETVRQSIAEAGVADRFVLAGLVPFADVAGLLRHSVAMINPSLFEGWSTTVEEAKALGKRVLLSDIGVHREQAPPRGSFFATDDAEALADLMAEVLERHDPAEEAAAAAEAAALLPGRRRAFAATFEDIVVEAVEHPHG